MDEAAVLEKEVPRVATRGLWLAWLPNALSLLIVVLLAANYFGTFADLDFTWQIRTGGLILQTGNLRPPESFTYTIQGTSIPDFEWLYEVVLYGIWSVFGFGGLKMLRVVLVAAPLVLLGRRLRQQGIRWHGIILSIFTAIFILAPAWNLRPMYCTTIGLLLVSGWLHDHCTGRKPLSWWLPLVMLLWSNLHPGVITGQGLLAGALAWEWLNRWVRLNKPLDGPALRRLTAIGGLGLLASLIGPDPVERFLYPFKPELAHPIMRIFTEMQPTITFLTKPPFAIGLAYGVALLVLVTVILRFRQYRAWELMLLLGLAGLGNVAFRGLQDWLLVMLALGVPHAVKLVADAARADRRRWWVRRLLRLDGACKRVFHGSMLRWQTFWPATAMSVLLVLSLIPPISRKMPMQDATDWPVAALDFIEQQGLSGNFFAPPDYGSYLLWRLGSRVRSYTDTRGFFFPPVLLEDSQFIPQLGPDWQGRLRRVLDEYPTDWFLLETTGSRGALWQRLQRVIGQPLYQDEKTVLLSAEQVRRGLTLVGAGD
jgi:hypothetical protein